MILPSRLVRYIVFAVFLLCSCLNFNTPQEKPFITDAQKALIRQFATENGFPSSVPIDKFVEYLYFPWPDDDKIKDFILTFPIQDSIPKTLVLPDILTTIGKSLRVCFSDPRTGGVYPAFIDSIEIKTDSVIILPSLSLEDCHLTHLPATINKIRTRSLNIGYNYRTLLSLPNELMDMEKPPVYWDSLFVRYDYGAVNSMNSDSVSDTLKAWLKAHYR